MPIKIKRIKNLYFLFFFWGDFSTPLKVKVDQLFNEKDCLPDAGGGREDLVGSPPPKRLRKEQTVSHFMAVVRF